MENFSKNFKALKEYKQTFQKFPKQKDNLVLYTWMSSIRTQYKNHRLLPEEIAELEAIGFIWNSHEHIWQKNFAQLRSLSSEEMANLPIDNEKLNQWRRIQEMSFYKGKLTSERMEQIKSFVERPELGVIYMKAKMSPVVEAKWFINYDRLVEFRKRSPHRWPGKTDNDPIEMKLHSWCYLIRQRQKDGKLPSLWRERLEAIGFNFNALRDNWISKYEALKKHLEENNGILSASIHKKKYSWYRSQLRKKLDKEQQKMFKSLPPVQTSEILESSWMEQYHQLAAYIEAHGKVPTYAIHPKIGSWSNAQRALYKKGKLSKERIHLLKKLGIQPELMLNRFAYQWEQKFEKLRSWRRKNPGLWPVIQGSLEEERKLAFWCRYQLMRGKQPRKPLSAEQAEKLKDIGFPFSDSPFTKKRVKQ